MAQRTRNIGEPMHKDLNTWGVEVTQLRHLLGQKGWGIFKKYAQSRIDEAVRAAMTAQDPVVAFRHVQAARAITEMVAWPEQSIALYETQVELAKSNGGSNE